MFSTSLDSILFEALVEEAASFVVLLLLEGLLGVVQHVFHVAALRSILEIEEYLLGGELVDA